MTHAPEVSLERINSFRACELRDSVVVSISTKVDNLLRARGAVRRQAKVDQVVGRRSNTTKTYVCPVFEVGPASPVVCGVGRVLEEMQAIHHDVLGGYIAKRIVSYGRQCDIRAVPVRNVIRVHEVQTLHRECYLWPRESEELT